MKAVAVLSAVFLLALLAAIRPRHELDRPLLAAGVAGNAPGRVVRAQDFVDGLGVNIKIKDLSSKYENSAAVLKQLQYLGLRLVREGFPARELSHRQLDGFQTLAKAGVRFLFVTHNEKPVDEIVADIANFERSYPGSVHAVEGPNELNNWPITYKGNKGKPAARLYMEDLYSAVKGNSTLAAANVLVYTATDYPAIATKGDRANIHSYERNAYGSHELLRIDRDNHLSPFRTDNITPPGSSPRWVVTETGYHTWIGSGYFEGVAPPTHAQLGLGLLLNVVQLGGGETYWYQLWDAWGPPRSGEEAFGLFDHLGNPKPLARGLHNLVGVLRDEHHDARQCPTTPLDFSLSGNLGKQPHNGVYHLLMQKCSGSYYLAIWREGIVWNAAADEAKELKPEMTTVHLTNVATKVEIMEPLEKIEPRAVHHGVSRIDLPLTASPIILRID
jgi:hypothetical protein